MPAGFIGIHKDLQEWIGSFFSPVVEWKEPGPVSHESSSLLEPVVFVVSVLKTRLQQRKTPTCRSMMAALHMLTHALLKSTSLWASPENGPIHGLLFSNTKLRKTQGLLPVNHSDELKCNKKVEWHKLNPLVFDNLYVKLSSLSLKGYTRKRQARYLSIQIQYNVHKRLNNVHKRLTEARFRFVTMTSTNCIKVQNSCSGQKYHTFICTI